MNQRLVFAITVRLRTLYRNKRRLHQSAQVPLSAGAIATRYSRSTTSASRNNVTQTPARDAAASHATPLEIPSGPWAETARITYGVLVLGNTAIQPMESWTRPRQDTMMLFLFLPCIIHLLHNNILRPFFPSLPFSFSSSQQNTYNPIHRFSSLGRVSSI